MHCILCIICYEHSTIISRKKARFPINDDYLLPSEVSPFEEDSRDMRELDSRRKTPGKRQKQPSGEKIISEEDKDDRKRVD